MRVKLIQPIPGIGVVGTDVSVSDARGNLWITEGVAEAAGGFTPAVNAEVKPKGKPKTTGKKPR